MATRTKRWSGNIETIPLDFFKDVQQKMEAYGDKVQFSLVSKGPLPPYQVINELGKAMAFDAKHHLFRPEENEFDGSNAGPTLTMEEVRSLVAGKESQGRVSKTARPVRVVSRGTRTSAAAIAEQVANQRWLYFREHRSSLPASISEYAAEIDDLLKSGKSPEEAFGEVVRKHY